ncbi:IS3 family transposase [Pandoraea anhela]|uniref:IS3 family transposase n=1 Tax=Pandoraea anhela TaxID=2508295 RepID=A0A5E4Y0J2_9BURK|nr:IS3 family transposase [Pandoraea anhela]
MKGEGLRAEVSYGSKPRYLGCPVGMVAHVLNREFAPNAPNKARVTGITYSRIYESWRYLAAVIDLYSHRIVGWGTRSTMTIELELQASLAAVWKPKPIPGVMVHSKQDSHS